MRCLLVARVLALIGGHRNDMQQLSLHVHHMFSEWHTKQSKPPAFMQTRENPIA